MVAIVKGLIILKSLSQNSCKYEICSCHFVISSSFFGFPFAMQKLSFFYAWFIFGSSDKYDFEHIAFLFCSGTSTMELQVKASNLIS